MAAVRISEQIDGKLLTIGWSNSTKGTLVTADVFGKPNSRTFAYDRSNWLWVRPGAASSELGVSIGGMIDHAQ